MASKISHQIERLRLKLGMSQAEFATLFNTSAMSISRWERNSNLPDARALLKLGIMAKNQQMDGWMFWNVAGLTRDVALTALVRDKVQAAPAGAAQ